MRRNNVFLSVLDGLALIALFLLGWLQLSRMFCGDVAADDFEHLSTAWFMLNGFVPYRDFFQHHNPLFWYLLKPFFSL